MAQGAAFQPPPEAVTTIVASEEEWPATLSAIGTMAAVQGVTVSADLPGTVERILFDSGQAVQRRRRAGRARHTAGAGAARGVRGAARAGAASPSIAWRGCSTRRSSRKRSSIARPRSRGRATRRSAKIHAVIERKTIRAPFSGMLGIRQVNLGQYLAGGDPLVTLQSLNPIYVNFGVPQQSAGQMPVGRAVRITSEDAGRRRVVAGGSRPSTRWSTRRRATSRCRRRSPTPDGKLRPGMFVQTEVALGPSQRVVALPASPISYAPYGDSVFIVADMKDEDGKPYRGVRQQFVKLGPARGDQVAVLSGVKPGDEVVTSGALQAPQRRRRPDQQHGAAGNEPAPKPENS